MYGLLPEIDTKDGGKVQGYPILIPNPEKTAVVRLPTSGEWTSFMSSQRVIITDLGRGASRSEDMPVGKAYEKLFNAIRIDRDGVPFDEAEMQKAVGIISRHRVVSCLREGDGYTVKVATLFDDTDDEGRGIPTVHTVRIPYEKEMDAFRRTSYIETQLPNNRTEQQFPVAAPVTLYDAILVSVTGYANDTTKGVADIPPHHKKTVVNAVLAALAALDPQIDPNF